MFIRLVSTFLGLLCLSVAPVFAEGGFCGKLFEAPPVEDSVKASELPDLLNLMAGRNISQENMKWLAEKVERDELHFLATQMGTQTRVLILARQGVDTQSKMAKDICGEFRCIDMREFGRTHSYVNRHLLEALKKKEGEYPRIGHSAVAAGVSAGIATVAGGVVWMINHVNVPYHQSVPFFSTPTQIFYLMAAAVPFIHYFTAVFPSRREYRRDCDLRRHTETQNSAMKELIATALAGLNDEIQVNEKEPQLTGSGLHVRNPLVLSAVAIDSEIPLREIVQSIEKQSTFRDISRQMFPSQVPPKAPVAGILVGDEPTPAQPEIGGIFAVPAPSEEGRVLAPKPRLEAR